MSIPLVVLVMRIAREHGPLTDPKLVAIGRSIRPGVPDSSWRGRRAELVRQGQLEKVGITRDGHSIFDVVGIVRTPAVPLEQKTLWS